MRAIVVEGFGPPERLRVGEVAEPAPGPDEVLVMVHAAPVNYVDLLVVGGNYQFIPPLPFIPGKGPAGAVTTLGREVTTAAGVRRRHGAEPRAPPGAKSACQFQRLMV